MTTVELKPPKQRVEVPNREYRRDNANLALGCFTKNVLIEIFESRYFVSWDGHGGERVIKRWQLRSGQSFYATWSDEYPGGGTSMTALSQLVRWIQGRPVLPLSTWEYWAGESCKLARGRGQEMVERLKHAQYPETTHCVLCGRVLDGLDWWCLDGISGPCCPGTSGCEQKARPVRKGGRQ